MSFVVYDVATYSSAPEVVCVDTLDDPYSDSKQPDDARTAASQSSGSGLSKRRLIKRV